MQPGLVGEPVEATQSLGGIVLQIGPRAQSRDQQQGRQVTSIIILALVFNPPKICWRPITGNSVPPSLLVFLSIGISSPSGDRSPRRTLEAPVRLP